MPELKHYIQVEMCRIYWRSLITGHEGHGEPIPRLGIERKIDQLNQEYPELFHWYEIERRKAWASEIAKGAEHAGV